MGSHQSARRLVGINWIITRNKSLSSVGFTSARALPFRPSGRRPCVCTLSFFQPGGRFSTTLCSFLWLLLVSEGGRPAHEPSGSLWISAQWNGSNKRKRRRKRKNLSHTQKKNVATLEAFRTRRRSRIVPAVAMTPLCVGPCVSV